MSHRIVYEHLAVLFPANTLKAELGHWSLYQYLRQNSCCFCMNSADFRGLENPLVD